MGREGVGGKKQESVRILSVGVQNGRTGIIKTGKKCDGGEKDSGGAGRGWGEFLGR